MHALFTLDPKRCGLLVIDLQEKLFQKVERAYEVAQNIYKTIRGCQLLQIPIIVSEQYPKGLGPTLEIVKQAVSPDQCYFDKTSFSCCLDRKLQEHLQQLGRDQWILVGMEAHICVLQTAKDLVKEKMQVVVLNDAITSRSIFDYSTAIAEMRDSGIRVSSIETVLFEMVRDSKADVFKEISQLVK